MKPATHVVKVQHSIICTSDGLNKKLQNTEVDSAWSREGGSNWDDEE